MKRSAVAVSMLAFLAACAAEDKSPTADQGSQLSLSVWNTELNGPQDARVHHVKGWENAADKAAGFAIRRSPNMTYHGGKVMTTANITAIYWGTSWATDASDKRAGLDDFYTGWSGSGIAKSNNEYTGLTGQVTGSTATYGGRITDTSPASGGASTSAILAEVCKVITNPDPTGNGYYPVYTDIPRGTAGYCAWHSSGTCGGKTVQFAFFWKLDGDSGCDPGDPNTVNSQGLEALANVSAHELSEALTDPINAWYDPSGNENADKCAWVFTHPSTTQTLNGRPFRMQGNWSNAAYNAGASYPNVYKNSAGQLGCIATR